MTIYIHEINIQRREAASYSFECHDRLLTVRDVQTLRRTVTIQESAFVLCAAAGAPTQNCSN
jgi:hypothetical protein